MMIPAWVVSLAFLFTAIMFKLSPMPKYIKAMLMLAFGSFGMLYLLYTIVFVPETRDFFTRLSLIILNAAINLALLAAAKGRPWNRRS